MLNLPETGSRMTVVYQGIGKNIIFLENIRECLTIITEEMNMPYIQVKTNREVTKKEEIELKTLLGKDISLLPGKSEAWLMVQVEDRQKLYFQGSDEACAILEVKVYSEGDKIDYGPLTKALTDKVSSLLKIKKDRIYIEYEETPNWGWAGSNF